LDEETADPRGIAGTQDCGIAEIKTRTKVRFCNLTMEAVMGAIELVEKTR
jgi:hypothetical protein